MDWMMVHCTLVLAQCISGMLLHYWLAVSGRVHFCQVDTIWSALHCVALHYSTLAVTGVWSPFIKGHDCMHLFVFIIVITLDDVGFLSECSIILCNVWPLNPCYAQCWPVSFCVCVRSKMRWQGVSCSSSNNALLCEGSPGRLPAPNQFSTLARSLSSLPS